MARSKTTRSSAGLDVSSPNDAGFSLVEILVALAVFTVMAIAASTALITTIQVSNQTQNRVVANNLARLKIEQIEGQALAGFAPNVTPTTTALRGKTFFVSPSLAIVSPASTFTCKARAVSVTVSWANSANRKVRYDTVLSC